MELSVVKALCLGVLLVVSICMGLLPLKLKQIREWIATGMACFCGGLLLGVCFLDFLPSIRSPKSVGLSTSYPITELLVMVGFLCVLMLDKFADLLSSQLKIKNLSENCNPQECHVEEKRDDDVIEKPIINEKTPLLSSPQSVMVEPAAEIPTVQCDNPKHGLMRKLKDRSNFCQLWLSSQSFGATLKSIALVAAVAVHSILEGIVLGLEESKIPLIQLTSLITFHKSLVLFSVGVTLNDQKVPLSLYIKEIVFLSLASPIGGIIGMLVDSAGKGVEESPVAFILKCLATGTFIFVTFFEILSKKVIVNRWRDFLNVLVCIIGFGCFCGMAAIPHD